MDDVTGPDLRADAAHILASLPNLFLCLMRMTGFCF